jgi:DnaJ-class molecular chaperone
MTICPTCKGKKEVRRTIFSDWDDTIPCPDCAGSGEVTEQKAQEIEERYPSSQEDTSGS